jgi:hypothetical protein
MLNHVGAFDLVHGAPWSTHPPLPFDVKFACARSWRCASLQTSICAQKRGSMVVENCVHEVTMKSKYQDCLACSSSFVLSADRLSYSWFANGSSDTFDLEVYLQSITVDQLP